MNKGGLVGEVVKRTGQTRADVARVVDRTLATFGGIDILILNGGGPPPGTAARMTPEEVGSAVELLLVSHVRLVSLSLEHLRSSGRGRIG